MSDKFEFPQELMDGLREIAIMQNAQQRQAVTMLAGFIATDERDIRYMDEYMDPLFGFIEPGTDTEDVVRKYIAHIATFDPETAVERTYDLDDHLGYKTKIVYAAGLLAQKLHSGQVDKGGNDYFTSHLLKVAERGFRWRDKVTGFLHDAVEDCGVTVDEVMDMLDKEIVRITTDSNDKYWEEDWWQEWMEDIAVCPAEETYPMTTDERNEIAEALNLLNHHTATSRKAYIERLNGSLLAINTKLHDLENNMDLSRLPSPTQKDVERVARYKKEQTRLYEMLNEMFPIANT